jgi:hypothetical protein
MGNTIDFVMFLVCFIGSVWALVSTLVRAYTGSTPRKIEEPKKNIPLYSNYIRKMKYFQDLGLPVWIKIIIYLLAAVMGVTGMIISINGGF